MDDYSRHEDHHRRANIVLIGFLVVGGFYLFTEHRAHLFGILPYLIFLACPVMHLFMHHGHGHGGSDHSPNRDAAERLPSDTSREIRS